MRKAIVVLLCASAALNAYLLFVVFSNQSATQAWISKYPLLSKRLASEDHNDILIDFDPLRQEVKNYLSEKAVPHSFYFEYLPTGTNIRDGDSNELVGASLMKIPIVMTLYKAAEAGKVSMNQQVTVERGDISGDAEYGSPGNLKVGDKLTLREAADIALVESDNTAAYIVYRSSWNLLPENERAVTNLDIEVQERMGEEGEYLLISARAYSSILKCLYLACYLSEDSSQEILHSLTTSNANDRLGAGLPEGVAFANKIGSFSTTTQSDCGIAYVPNRPYVLCVMLETNDANAKPILKDISQMVYNYVKEVN